MAMVCATNRILFFFVWWLLFVFLLIDIDRTVAFFMLVADFFSWDSNQSSWSPGPVIESFAIRLASTGPWGITNRGGSLYQMNNLWMNFELMKINFLNINFTLERLRLRSPLWWNTGLSFLIRTILARRPLGTLTTVGIEWFLKRVDHSEWPLTSSPFLGEGGGVTWATFLSVALLKRNQGENSQESRLDKSFVLFIFFFRIVWTPAGLATKNRFGCHTTRWHDCINDLFSSISNKKSYYHKQMVTIVEKMDKLILLDTYTKNLSWDLKPTGSDLEWRTAWSNPTGRIQGFVVRLRLTFWPCLTPRWGHRNSSNKEHCLSYQHGWNRTLSWLPTQELDAYICPGAVRYVRQVLSSHQNPSVLVKFIFVCIKFLRTINAMSPIQHSLESCHYFPVGKNWMNNKNTLQVTPKQRFRWQIQ